MVFMVLFVAAMAAGLLFWRSWVALRWLGFTRLESGALAVALAGLLMAPAWLSLAVVFVLMRAGVPEDAFAKWIARRRTAALLRDLGLSGPHALMESSCAT